MAKVSIKSEKSTPFGGIFHVREHFSRFVCPVIDNINNFDSVLISCLNPDIFVVLGKPL